MSKMLTKHLDNIQREKQMDADGVVKSLGIPCFYLKKQ